MLEAAGIEHELSLELSAGWAASVVFTPAMLEPEIATRVEQLVQEMLEPRSVVERIALGHMAGLEMLMSGRRDVVERMARAAWGDGALMREAGVDEPAIWAVTAAAYGLGDLDRVLRVTDLVAANATSAGAPLAAATAACVRSLALLQRGDVTGAFADVERAVQVSGSLGDTRHWDTFLPAALSVGAHALIARGELERAEALLTLSDEQEAAWSQLLLYLPLLEARGYLELARDRPAESMRHWDRHLKLTTRHFGREVNSAFHGGWRCGATEALVQLGRHDEALELALVELDNARSWGQARAIGRALRAVGRARGADGVDDLAAGAALLEQHGLLLDLAWTLHDFASGLRAAGRRREAREQLQRALELADRIEARHLSARAREALVAIGGSPSRERSSGARSLTAAERRVARLAADGLSNREIAERLFVTMHAIRFHLRNAYAKLQVDGRDQLAGALRELDDEPSRSG